jgi:hypothetical protein
MYTYPGNIHIHSTFSDGSGSIDEIASAAARAGLSYIIIADHETLAGFSRESFINNVLVLVGMEINHDKNHYLAFGLQETVASNDNNPQQVIDQVSRAGGLGFIAHPFDRGSRYVHHGKAYPWKDWPVFGFNGLEIWNFSSHWRGLRPSLLRTYYWFFLNRKGAMKGPPRRLLRLWDCYNMHGHKTTAVGGSDAHAVKYRLLFIPITIFTYQYIFTTINTYVAMKKPLQKDFTAAKNQVLKALREGACFVSFDTLGPAREFSFTASTGGGQCLMGEEIPLDSKTTLVIKAPGKRALIRLIHNGSLQSAAQGNTLTYKPVQPGVYRVEVYHRSLLGRIRPWIYSNPIYVTGKA